jgi:hypothetical protein
MFGLGFGCTAFAEVDTTHLVHKGKVDAYVTA